MEYIYVVIKYNPDCTTETITTFYSEQRAQEHCLFLAGRDDETYGYRRVPISNCDRWRG